jgi:hypothetical protein
VLPKEENFTRTREYWLLIFTNNFNDDTHQAILLVPWRPWHLRNDIGHAKGDTPIEQSARFLLSYIHTLHAKPLDCVKPVWKDRKGKKHVLDLQGIGSSKTKTVADIRRQWDPPPMGCLKANLDGSLTLLLARQAL